MIKVVSPSSAPRARGEWPRPALRAGLVGIHARDDDSVVHRHPATCGAGDGSVGVTA